jgi:ferrochelatase
MAAFASPRRLISSIGRKRHLDLLLPLTVRPVLAIPVTEVAVPSWTSLAPIDTQTHDWATTKPPTKLGVLLLNLGGPENQDDVEGFLYNLFADPDIIRLPKFVSGLQKPLATLLSKRRAPQSREAYESIGGGSPIVAYTTAQARALEARLQELGYGSAKCYVGMRYWYPFTEQALDEIKQDGVNALVILPLYPQFSISTSGSSLRVLQETFAAEPAVWGADRLSHTVVPAWYNRPGYVKQVAKLVNAQLATYSAEETADGGLHVLFSAHGVPDSYIAAGDPYQRQMVECVDLIGAQLLGGTQVHLSYQSRVGPVEWLKPYTDVTLRELGASGVKNLVVVPISFVSEHIETLEEIDMEYRDLAEASGVTRWRRTPALNTDPAFIDELASMVTDALGEPTLSVSAACIQNNCEVELEAVDRRFTTAGINEGAETLNGRIAMVGFLTTFAVQVLSAKGASWLAALGAVWAA